MKTDDLEAQLEEAFDLGKDEGVQSGRLAFRNEVCQIVSQLIVRDPTMQKLLNHIQEMK